MTRRYVVFNSNGYLFARPAHKNVGEEQHRDGYGRSIDAVEVMLVNLPRNRQVSRGSVRRALERVMP